MKYFLFLDTKQTIFVDQDEEELSTEEDGDNDILKSKLPNRPSYTCRRRTVVSPIRKRKIILSTSS